jgi:hypothetical protein
MRAPDEIRVGPIVMIGVIGLVVTVVIVLGLQALVLREEQAEYRRKVVDRPYRELLNLEADQSEVLDAYRWIDEEKGVVGIPVERAMEIVVREERARAAAGD